MRVRIPALVIDRIRATAAAALCLGLAASLYMSLPSPGRCDPLGQIIWTRIAGSQASIRFKNYFPGSTPSGMSLTGDLELRDGSNRITFNHSGDFKLQHPCFDFSGTKLFFTEGIGLFVKDAATSPKIEKPKTNLFCQNPSSPFLTDGANKKGDWDALLCPASDPDGDFVYYVRFRYAKDPAENGFFLERCTWEGKADAAFNELKIRGIYPAVNSTGRFIAFSRQDVYRSSFQDSAWKSDMPPAGGFDTSVDLWVYDTKAEPGDPEGSAPNPLLVVDASANRRALKPTWGPFSDKILFSYNFARSHGDGTNVDKKHTTSFPYRIWGVPFRADDFAANQDPTILRTGPDRGDTFPVTESADDVDHAWPSASADGRYVCFTVQARDGSGKAQVHQAEVSDSGPGSPTAVDGDTSADQAWPLWNQDEDPPNVEVRIVPTDSNQVTRIAFYDKNPDPEPLRDNGDLFVTGINFTPAPSASPTPNATWENFFYSTSSDHGIALVLSNAAEIPDDYDGHEKLAKLGSPPAGFDAIEAIYVRQNVRVKVQVHAKDDKWLRVIRSLTEEGKGIAPDASKERWPTYIDPLAPEAQYETSNQEGKRNSDAPYLPRIEGKSLLNDGQPGVAWWVERLETGSDWEARCEPYSDGATNLVFRKPNYPRDKYPDTPKYYFIRVVAQDPWQNRTDLMIPIVVIDTAFKVKALGFDSQRRLKPDAPN